MKRRAKKSQGLMIRVPSMDMQSDWENDRRLKNFLSQHLEKGSLAIILGAGISTEISSLNGEI